MGAGLSFAASPTRLLTGTSGGAIDQVLHTSQRSSPQRCKLRSNSMGRPDAELQRDNAWILTVTASACADLVNWKKPQRSSAGFHAMPLP